LCESTRLGRVGRLQPAEAFRVACHSEARGEDVDEDRRRTWSARLQALARPGQIVISRATRDGIGDRATVTSLGAFDVKGKREPVEAFELVSLSG
jgi:hypothetical protein